MADAARQTELQIEAAARQYPVPPAQAPAGAPQEPGTIQIETLKQITKMLSGRIISRAE